MKKITLNKYLLSRNQTKEIDGRLLPNPFPDMLDHFDKLIWTLDYMLLQIDNKKQIS